MAGKRLPAEKLMTFWIRDAQRCARDKDYASASTALAYASVYARYHAASLVRRAMAKKGRRP